ncbi:MAG: hypothetical protein CM1200mP41_19410 [Gammaproteobacteria bacterium]|nr:MAG: hypothetical protein CM1200mP41_19410 [Gammaproteobacteria bacterium]
MATLEVRNLQTSFFTKAGEVKAVDDVSFFRGPRTGVGFGR